MKNLKIFIITFLLGVLFWWGINVFQKILEEVIYAKIIEKDFFHFSNTQTSSLPSCHFSRPEVSAQSALLVAIDKNGREKIIFQKEKNIRMPIASLTKLMTAIIVTEFYQPDLKIKISSQAIEQPEMIGFLKVGEIFKVEDLLYMTLIESSNDASYALAEIIGIEGFVSLMNLKAQELNLQDTYFFNPTGIDSKEFINYSTTEDLKELAKYLLKKTFFLEILSQKEYPLYKEDKSLHHILYNTNKLLEEIPSLLAGKTGYTLKAGGCLISILKKEKPETYFIAVILNSPNRFEDMRKLIKYVSTSCSSN